MVPGSQTKTGTEGEEAMTLKINDKVIIRSEPPRKCELCGKIAELRPYGPNREFICFECGMKDEETTSKQFGKLLEGEP